MSEILDIVHLDMCGSMEQESIDGGAYYVLFLNDFSNKLFAYMIKNKSEVPKIFEAFKNMVENQTEKKLRNFALKTS